uniref:Uncharacterized protein n=1 Tax=Aegilops tauschii TaxID=37682 RepID=M8CWF7_AEGTA
MAGEKSPRAFSMEELPGHLIGEVLSSGRLAAGDLARLEGTCRALRPLAEQAASRLCAARMACSVIGPAARGEMQVATGRYHTLLVHDSSVYSCGSSLCGVLGHGPDTTQCVAFSRVSFPSLARVVNISAFHNHAAFVTESGEVFTCGDNSSACCGHGDVGRTIFRPTQILALKGISCKQLPPNINLGHFAPPPYSSNPILFPSQFYRPPTSSSPTMNSFTAAAAAERRCLPVSTCQPISYTVMATPPSTIHPWVPPITSRPLLPNHHVGSGSGSSVPAFHKLDIPAYDGSVDPPGWLNRCEQFFHGQRKDDDDKVATGLSFTVILTRKGLVYTCGSNTHGQLGHGDTTDRAAPKIVELFKGPSPVVQVAAGASYTFAVTDDGTVYSFGSCTNFCLGHGDQHNELLPRAIQSFKRRNILVVRVSAGDEHAVALDALGYVYTWGRGYCGALGHGDENDKTSPELIVGLKGQVAVQGSVETPF